MDEHKKKIAELLIGSLRNFRESKNSWEIYGYELFEDDCKLIVEYIDELKLKCENNDIKAKLFNKEDEEKNIYKYSLDRMSNHVGIGVSQYGRSKKFRDDFRNLKRLVDKQTPKKPKRDIGKLLFCPMCNHLIFRNGEYCEKCGQKIDYESNN